MIANLSTITNKRLRMEFGAFRPEMLKSNIIFLTITTSIECLPLHIMPIILSLAFPPDPYTMGALHVRLREALVRPRSFHFLNETTIAVV